MIERPFLDVGGEPTDSALRATLASAHASWTRLMRLTDGFAARWSFAGKSGWMLKVFDRKKALLYLVLLRERFRVSLTIRGAERVTFLADADLATLRDQIESARRYAEGYALNFEVADEADTAPLESLIGKLVALRKSN